MDLQIGIAGALDGRTHTLNMGSCIFRIPDSQECSKCGAAMTVYVEGKNINMQKTLSFLSFSRPHGIFAYTYTVHRELHFANF